MENKEKLTLSQVSFITFASAAGNIVYTFTFITVLAERAFWLAELIGVLLNIPFAIWILYLGKQSRENTIFDILEHGIGKILTKFLLMIFYFINIAAAVCMVNMFTGTLKVFFLKQTPSFVIMLFIIALCAVFVNSGIKSLARLIEVLSVLYTINFYLGFFLSFFKLFKVAYVLPVFDTSSLNFLEGTMITAGSCSECLLPLMVLMGKIPMGEKRNLSVAKGILCWAVFLSFATFIFEGDIGHEMLSRIAQAGITVARVIQIKNFIRGMEILILMTYQYFAISTISLFINSCYIASSRLFNTQKSKFLLIATAILIFTGSVFLNSFNNGYYLALFLGSYILLPFSLLLLILATICVAVKKVKNAHVNSV